MAGVISDFHPLRLQGRTSLRCPRRKQAGQTAARTQGYLRASEKTEGNCVGCANERMKEGGRCEGVSLVLLLSRISSLFPGGGGGDLDRTHPPPPPARGHGGYWVIFVGTDKVSANFSN